jgi:hypothetical protein
VALEFAQVVAKLVETVGFFGKLEALENDLMNVLGAPAAEIIASVQKNLQEPDDACLMDLYTRIIDRAGDDRQGQALEQSKVHVDV